MQRLVFILSFFFLHAAIAQNPFAHFSEAIDLRYDSKQPIIHYTLEVNQQDLSFIKVEMHLQNIPHKFLLGMFVHPEYDDRFYRYVEDLEVETAEGKGSILRKENTLWQVQIKTNEATVRYRIHLPKTENQRGAWRLFLSAHGGLIGGPQNYMYVVGSELAPAYVHLQIPQGWKVATGLQSTSDERTFVAGTINNLMDGPILIGHFHQWPFTVEGVPHRVIYLSAVDSIKFDSSSLVSSIKKISEQARLLFGRFPYRDYSFLLQDDSYGALEHNNSVTIGAPAQQLETNMEEYLSEITHEYFHAWNIVRIRPAEYGDVSYKKPQLSKGLWWSEGLTMFYTYLLQRRAGFPLPSRIDHLKELMEDYYGNPAHYKISAERVSMASYALPGFLGDYDGSTHLQGEIIGYMLDIFIRNATGGKKTIEDVMRLMNQHFGGRKGFTSGDIEQAAFEISGKNLKQFFSDHVRGNKAIDFNRMLQQIGLHAKIEWVDAEDGANKPLPDYNVYAYQLPASSKVFAGIRDPESCWGKAGLHTGTELISINGLAIAKPGDLYASLRQMKVGDQIEIDIRKNDKPVKTHVVVTGFKKPQIKIEEKFLSPKQRRLLQQWKEETNN